MKNKNEIISRTFSNKSLSKTLKSKSKVEKIIKDSGIKIDASSINNKAEIKNLISFFKDMAFNNYKMDSYSYFKIGAGLIYFLNPMDVIIDYIPFMGLIDDCFILTLILSTIKFEFDEYMSSEVSQTDEEFQVYEDVNLDKIKVNLNFKSVNAKFDVNDLTISNSYLYNEKTYQAKTLNELQILDEIMFEKIFNFFLNVNDEKIIINLKNISKMFTLTNDLGYLKIHNLITNWTYFIEKLNLNINDFKIEYNKVNNFQIEIKTINKSYDYNFEYQNKFNFSKSVTALSQDNYIILNEYNLLDEQFNSSIIYDMIFYANILTSNLNYGDKLVMRFLFKNYIVDIKCPSITLKLICLKDEDYFYMNEINKIFTKVKELVLYKGVVNGEIKI